MSDIELSVITISYNTREIMKACIASIMEHTKNLNYEIVVVDNGSKDGSVEMLRELSKKHREIIFIDAKENLGFGRGNNLGAQKARGEYLLFLNSDTLVFDNALKSSLEDFKKHSEAGVYSCQLLNRDRSTQPSGGYFPTLGRLLAWQFFIDDLPLLKDMIKSVHPHKNIEGYPDWVTGAFMMVKKSVFEKAGRFDKDIFMYTEEMELCYRIAKLGYKTYYSENFAIIHLGGASGGSVLAITSEIKNMIYFWKKHLPVWQLPVVRIAFLLGSLLRLLIFGIIKGDEKARRAYLQAFGYIL